MDLTQNYFELFGLPVSYTLDSQQLAERYRELQKVLHPDRHAGGTDRERRLSVQQAALINAAFQTLKSPQQRARYLLELRGVSFNDENDTHFDGGFLLEQMELHEALAEVRQATDPLQALAAIQQQLNASRERMLEQLAQLLEHDLPEQRQSARQLVQKLQFFSRLQQEAEEIEEGLLDSL